MHEVRIIQVNTLNDFLQVDSLSVRKSSTYDFSIANETIQNSIDKYTMDLLPDT